VSYKDISRRSAGISLASIALVAALVVVVNAACNTHRRVLSLVGHDYCFQGIVLDARGNRPLDGAVLSLSIWRSPNAPPDTPPEPVDGVSLARYGDLRPEVIAADGSFRFHYLLKDCESHEEFLGIRYNPTDRPPPVRFLVTVRREGYTSAAREVLPPAAYSPRHQYGVPAIEFRLEPSPNPQAVTMSAKPH